MLLSFVILSVSALIIIDAIVDAFAISSLRGQLYHSLKEQTNGFAPVRSSAVYDVLFWILSVVLAVSFIFFKQGLFADSVLSQSIDKGFGGFSFISAITGLNLAIIKFHYSLKPISEIEELLKIKVEKRLQSILTSSDNGSLPLQVKMKELIHFKANEAWNARNQMGWLWRRLAIHMSVVGLFLLFFNVAAGFFGIMLAIPVIGVAYTSRWPLFKESDILDVQSNIAACYAEEADEENKRKYLLIPQDT